MEANGMDGYKEHSKEWIALRWLQSILRPCVRRSSKTSRAISTARWSCTRTSTSVKSALWVELLQQTWNTLLFLESVDMEDGLKVRIQERRKGLRKKRRRRMTSSRPSRTRPSKIPEFCREECLFTLTLPSTTSRCRCWRWSWSNYCKKALTSSRRWTRRRRTTTMCIGWRTLQRWAGWRRSSSTTSKWKESQLIYNHGRSRCLRQSYNFGMHLFEFYYKAMSESGKLEEWKI